METRLGVGFIGAGPVTQAIHLPALARLPGLFRVVQVMDTDLQVATAVAGRLGARATDSVPDLLENPDVDVVAVCSPHRFHAGQTIAAGRAGKRAVLCEKPVTLTVPEAEAVARVSRETGVPVVVGTMHAFDPAWKRAVDAWGDPAGSVHTIRSSIVLPPNQRMEDFATEVVGRPPAAEPDVKARGDDPPRTPRGPAHLPSPQRGPDPQSADLSDVEVQAAVVHRGIMGVAIHNMPHVRRFLPARGDLTILDSVFLPPFGYHIVATYGECRIDWHCRLYGTWKPDWVFEGIARDRALRIDFTPSYVQAGSARASIRAAAGTTILPLAPVNGYVEEWRELSRLALGRAPAPDLTPVVEDLRLTLHTAELAAGFLRERGRGQ